MSSIFTTHELSNTELSIAQAHLSDPVVKRYLHFLAQEQINLIAGSEQSEGESDHNYIRKLSRAKGSLDLFNTLLQIESPAPKAE